MDRGWFLTAIVGVWLTFGEAIVTPTNKFNEYLKVDKNLIFHPIDFYQPGQIHLAYGETIQEIVVTWSTFNMTSDSVVEFGEAETGSLNKIAKGSYKLFIDDGPEKHFQYIHRVTLKNLKPKTKYMYHCGSELGWSPFFFFTTVDFGTNWSPKLIFYGDMGNVNPRSLPYLQEEMITNSYAAILHVGDFAYDMQFDNGAVGDEFMNQIMPVAGYIPYMVSPGNHDKAYNFSHYTNRFSMPGPYESLMYSWDLGPIHFISLNTEAYYEFDSDVVRVQYEWLQNDLAEANKPENRAIRPWIITYGHRPMYCSYNGLDCFGFTSNDRADKFGLEKLLYDNGVDFMIWAHEHSYSRLWPVYDKVVLNGSTSHPYTNPRGPVQVTSGSAGCHDHYALKIDTSLPWFAFRSMDYGYSRLQVFNHTHLMWEQVSVDKGGKVIDKNWLIKDTHGTYAS